MNRIANPGSESSRTREIFGPWEGEVTFDGETSPQVMGEQRRVFGFGSWRI